MSTNINVEDEITLKELVKKLKEFYRELLSNWKIIICLVLLVGAFFVFKAITTPLTYPGNMTFMVNEDTGNGGGVGSILGQFGLGGGGGGEYNLDKIVELSKSLRITKEALFEKAVIGGKNDFFANHLILTEKFHEKWEDSDIGLEGFLFSHDSIANFSLTEKAVLKAVYAKVKGNPKNDIKGLMSISYKQETGIITMGMNTRSEAFSILFLREIYNKVSDFYILESTNKPQLTYRKLKEKKDSLSQVLAGTEYQLAKSMDSNIGLVSRAAKLKIDRLQREVQFLTIAYGKALENTEMADFGLKNSMPFFQIIDEPFAPIRPIKESKIKAILLGGFIGGFLGALFIILRKLYRDAMA